MNIAKFLEQSKYIGMQKDIISIISEYCINHLKISDVFDIVIIFNKINEPTRLSENHIAPYKYKIMNLDSEKVYNSKNYPKFIQLSLHPIHAFIPNFISRIQLYYYHRHEYVAGMLSDESRLYFFKKENKYILLHVDLYWCDSYFANYEFVISKRFKFLGKFIKLINERIVQLLNLFVHIILLL